MKADNRVIHGESKTRLFRIWQGAKNRCFNLKATNWSRYGGRGITMCEEWKDEFVKFRDWSLANGYKEYLTIDRVNNDGNYEPDNCQWIPHEENARKDMVGRKLDKEWCDNNSRSKVVYSQDWVDIIDDEVKSGLSIRAACEKHKVNRRTFYNVKKRIATRGF